MPIFFNKVERANPQDRKAPKKWYPSLKTISMVSDREMAKLIADETTINRKEVEMAIDQFQKILIRKLLDSQSVRLGDWGSFHLTCSGEGADTEAEVTANSIKSVNIRFTPGAEIREALAKATFISSDSITNKKTQSASPDNTDN